MESSSSASAIDYSSHFDRMIAVGEEIRDELKLAREALEAGNDHLESLATSQDTIAKAIGNLDRRASQETLGLFTRPITKGDGGLSRAAMINALKQANQLDNVRQEMAAPTPL